MTFEAIMRGGPMDGKVIVVQSPPPPEIYCARPADPMFFKSDTGPDVHVGIERLVYQRWGTTNQYVCMNDVDRAQEVINFARSIGLSIDDNQEQIMRYWFDDRLAGRNIR